jgi:transcriptional regulator with XRE-family HTH domain
LSQEKLGKLAGIDPMSASARMNQYERGKHSPDYQLMCRVAEILNMPVSWFYTEDEELARLQEIAFHLDANARRTLFVLAESLFAANPPVAKAVAAEPAKNPADLRLALPFDLTPEIKVGEALLIGE